MQSMTGFGNLRSRTPEVQLELSLKSVNGRYLELRLHTPREYSVFESDLRAIITKKFRRGSLDLFISRKPGTKAKFPEFAVDFKRARSWVKILSNLAAEVNIREPLSLQLLMQQPGLFHVDSTFPLQKNEKTLVISSLQKTIALCQKSRAREGSMLKRDLLDILQSLKGTVQEMERQHRAGAVDIEERIESKLVGLGLEGKIDSARLAQEVIFHLEKMDVSEELTRLNEHIEACRDLSSEKQPEGKKLDFYCQELFREVNTIGSKATRSLLTQHVVEAKTLIERMREQVQNIE